MLRNAFDGSRLIESVHDAGAAHLSVRRRCSRRRRGVRRHIHLAVFVLLLFAAFCRCCFPVLWCRLGGSKAW